MTGWQLVYENGTNSLSHTAKLVNISLGHLQRSPEMTKHTGMEQVSTGNSRFCNNHNSNTVKPVKLTTFIR